MLTAVAGAPETIAAGYVHLMARYNLWQNNTLLSAADRLDDAARQADRGAFFGSVTGTLSHVLWGDLTWMARFDGGPKPAGGIAGSATLFAEWEGYKTLRVATDLRILDWATGIQGEALTGDLVWYSGALQQSVSRPLALLVVHFFNHQTHHRGQVHAMLTAAGVRPGDTDLFIMPDVIG